MLTLHFLEAESEIDVENYDEYFEQFPDIYSPDGFPSVPQAIRPSMSFRESLIFAFDLYLRSVRTMLIEERPENDSSEIDPS